MRLDVHVIPNAKKEKLVEESGGLKIHLRAPAVDGKANEALIEFLAEHFNTKKRHIKIVSGEKSRRKVIEIAV